MEWLLRRIFTPDVTQVARTQHVASPYRAPIGVAVGVLSAPTLGVRWAATWIGLVLVCELWTWLATRPAMRRAMTRGEMARYLLSGVVTLPTWSSLGSLYWIVGGAQGGVIAVAAWIGQLLYTQRLIFESSSAMVVGNGVILGVMLLTPILWPRLDVADLLLLESILAISTALAIHASITARLRISTLARQNALIEHAAQHDPLTCLPNRGRFAARLASALTEEHAVAVLYMDLDRFKQVNDTLGHRAGDAVLRQFAARLASCCPESELARLGGDEFGVLVRGERASEAGTDELCRRILAAIAAPFRLVDGEAYVGVSIGVTTAFEPGAQADELLREADIALYAVKTGGRHGYRRFCPELDADVRHRAELEYALRAALTRGEGLSLVFQPKMDRSGRIGAVEALLRWRRDGEAISPAHFISVAEDTGLIMELGAWAFREAVAFAERWPQLKVAVNVSPRQLRDPTFAAFILAEVAQRGLDASQIELEITETALFEGSDAAGATLKTLRGAGFSVALDDFGTGYSSMKLLHSVAVDRVKIDKSFIDQLTTSHESAAIVQATTQLAHAMGLQVTAEGVETVEQRDRLVETQVDELQGYLISRPLTEIALAEFLSSAKPLPAEADPIWTALDVPAVPDTRLRA